MFKYKTRSDIKLNRSLLFNYLKTYILLLFILCLTTVVIFSIMNSSLKEQIEKVNKVLLQNTLTSLEKEFEVLDETISLINSNSRVTKYINSQFEVTLPSANYTAYEVMRDLSNYIGGNSFIDDIYIFFDDKSVVSSTYKANNPFYFKYLDKNYFNATELIGSYCYKKFIYSTDQDNLMLYYANSLPLGNKNNPKAIVLFKIKDTRITEILHDGMLTQKTETVIFNQNDSPFLAYPNGNHLESDNDVFKTTIFSPALQWRIESYVPRFEYEAKLIALRSTIINILLIALIIGVLIALYFSYNNYRPIANLMKILFPNDPDTIDENIFVHIENNISKTISENKSLKNRMNKQSELITSSIIERIVKHEQNEAKDIEEILDLSDIEFVSSRFAVCSIKLCVWDKHKINYTGIINELRELVSIDQHGYVFYMNDANISILIEIVNESIYSPEDFGRSCLRVLTRHNVSAAAGISNICSGIENINSSYKEALAALSVMPKDRGEVILYSSVQKLKTSSTKYYYPISVEQEIINGVKAGNIKKVTDYLDEVYNENFKEIQLSGQISRILIYNIISTVIKIMDELKIDLTSFEDANILDQLYNAETVNDAYSSLISVYTTICNVVNQNKKSNNVYLYEKIESFINNEYANNDLSLEYTAGKFNLSSSYLSRFFKEQAGINFNDYLQKLRIEKAKELMANNDNIMVQEVALLVGYNNSGSLIRAFNKYEGVTPKEYKSNYL